MLNIPENILKKTKTKITTKKHIRNTKHKLSYTLLHKLSHNLKHKYYIVKCYSNKYELNLSYLESHLKKYIFESLLSKFCNSYSYSYSFSS